MNNEIRLSRERCESTFWAVADCFIECRTTEPIVAQTYDDESRQRRWTPIIGEFLADVELGAKHALRHSPRLYTTFARLVLCRALDKDHSGIENAATVIRRCGREFVRRGLQPGRYFRKTRWGMA